MNILKRLTIIPLNHSVPCIVDGVVGLKPLLTIATFALVQTLPNFALAHILFSLIVSERWSPVVAPIDRQKNKDVKQLACVEPSSANASIRHFQVSQPLLRQDEVSRDNVLRVLVHHRKLPVSFTGGLFAYITISFQLANEKRLVWMETPENFVPGGLAGKQAQWAKASCELFWKHGLDLGCFF